jgi:hypothetical protein
MSNKRKAPEFSTLMSSPYGEAADNSYFGDPRKVAKEQYGLEHIERDNLDEDGVEQVVILGYN